MKTYKNVKDYYENANFSEQKIFQRELQTWLGCYTTSVANRVIEKMDDILSNATALKFIHELHERTQIEIKGREFDISIALSDEEFRSTNENWLHADTLTHAKSYRDVLYDMYIRE